MSAALDRRRPPRVAFLAAQVPAPRAPLVPSTTQLHEHLAEVLSDLRFPVQRWEVVTAAELHGVDLRTLALLRRLRSTTYADVATIADEIVNAFAEAAAALPGGFR